jgi:DNA-binding response OmpR family regulator
MRQARKKILCIEDDHETATLIKEELVHCGFDVDIASNGVEGFFAIMKLQPDLVLSDIIMPKASGFEVLRWLTTAMPRLLNMPFIFLTAMADRDVEMTARQLGADDFIIKPVDFDRLEAVIRACLERVARQAVLPKHRREQSRGDRQIDLNGAPQNICRTRGDSGTVQTER